jgi:preprotein translocase subunit SecF
MDLKMFALALMVGIVAGTYSSIFIASPLWYLWRTGGDKKQKVPA